jgi:hypothetical protein
MELPTVPLSLHHATFERHYQRAPGVGVTPDDTIAAAMRAAAEGRKLATQALDAYEKILADESVPMAGRLVRAKKAAAPLIESVGRKLDAAIDTVQAELSKLDKDMLPIIPPGESHLTTDGELRTLLRTASYEKRSELFAQASRAGDDSPVRAMLAGHPSLSGLSSDEMRARKKQYQRSRHPQTWARKERLEAALHDLKVASDAVVDFAKKLFAGATPHERASAAAAEAAAAAQKGATA